MKYTTNPSYGRPETKEIKIWPWILGTLGVFVLIWTLVLGINLVSSRATPQPNEVGIVRNGPATSWVGAWFNGHGIRSVIAPNSGSTFIGLGSTVHYYPSSAVQRTYTITGDPSRGDRPGVDVDEISTKDGIRIGLEGTFYFWTAFDGSPQGNALAKDFDNRFGTRTFPVAGSNKSAAPWQGQDGWYAYLDNVVRPIIDNDLRQQVGNVTCAQLVSSCALVYSQNVSATKGQNNQATLTAIQNSINQSLEQDIKSTLGVDYFSHIKFLITGKPRLPDQVQNEIDKAQAQFAAVGTARAQVQQAKLQAQANKEREAGYQGCPACAQIDELKAIPSNVTTYAPGGNYAVTH